MIEIPESQTLARQLRETLLGCVITGVFNATHPHKFTWYTGDPLDYPARLAGRKICGAEGLGAFVDLHLDEGLHLAVSDGVNLRYYASGEAIPSKYQLLITFDNDAFLVFTVAMYGGISLFKEKLDNPYYLGALTKPSPLEEQFDAAYFDRLVAQAGKSLSAKAFLATEQRIPGLGNGVLQDILFQCRVHPKRKVATLSGQELTRMYETVRTILLAMTQGGGRDTEKDLFGMPGGYRQLLSRNTCAAPCPVCGDCIVKEAYLGGAVYYCPACQPLS